MLKFPCCRADPVYRRFDKSHSVSVASQAGNGAVKCDNYFVMILLRKTLNPFAFGRPEFDISNAKTSFFLLLRGKPPDRGESRDLAFSVFTSVRIQAITAAASGVQHVGQMRQVAGEGLAGRGVHGG